jgi:hypothetical protein
VNTIAVLTVTLIFGALQILSASPRTRAIPATQKEDSEPQRDSKDLLVSKLKNATFRAEKGTVRLKNGDCKAGGDFTQLDAESVTLAATPSKSGITAAAVLDVNWGGTATMTELHAIRVERGIPKDLGFVMLGDRVGVKSLVVNGGEITVNMVTHGPDDPSCCPTLQRSATYRLAGSALVRKVSDEEVEDFLQQYEGALTNRAAVEITMALDPQAVYAMKQLSARLAQTKATEKAALAQIQRMGLRSDPRFKASLLERLARHKKAYNSQDVLTFSQANPGQQRAILVLGEIVNGLQRLK